MKKKSNLQGRSQERGGWGSRRRRRDVFLSAAGVLIGLPYTGIAQAALGDRSSQTELQSNTGLGVTAVCVQFVTEEVPVDTPQRVDLFDRCTEMVQTANELDGLTGPDIENSLGLTEEELNAALQQLAVEELAAPGSVTTETNLNQLSQVGSRMAALRAVTGPAKLAHAGNRGTGLMPAASTPDYAGAGLREQYDGQSFAYVPFGSLGGAAGDDDGMGRLSGFFTASVGTGDKDDTNAEDGFDFDSYTLTLGTDYRFTSSFVAGVALGYSNFDIDFDSNALVAGGTLDGDGYTGILYGTWYRENLYLDGVVSYGTTDLDQKRRIRYPTQNRTAKSDTDSDQWLFHLSAGYDFVRGQNTFTPYLGVTHLKNEIDDYRETGASGLELAVEDQDIDSTKSILGIHLSSAFSRPSGVLVPQAWAEWHHEFEDDARNVRTAYVADPNRLPLLVKTDDPDENYFLTGLGLSGVFAHGFQGFLSVEAILGLDDISSYAGTAGIRKEF